MGPKYGALDGIQMPVAGVEGNTLVANTDFIAVSNIKQFYLTFWLFILQAPWKGAGG